MRSGAAIREPTNQAVLRGREAATPSRSIGRALRALAALAAFVGLVVLLDAISRHAVPGNSDGATVILEGQTFAHGNLMLRGWALSLDSFWLLDVLFYALFVAVVGIRPELLNLVPAVIAALVVVVSVRLATIGARRGPAIAAAVCVIGLLALPTQLLAYFFLQGPLHVATALWCLVAFLLLRRLRFGIAFGVAVILLATAMDSDLQALFFGSVPIGLAGLALMLRRRSLRPGHVPVIAALASGVLGFALREGARAIGTFYVNSPLNTLSRGEIPLNLHAVLHYTANLLGVGRSTAVTGGNAVWFENLHVIGLALFALGALAALVRVVLGMLGGDLAGPSPEPLGRRSLTSRVLAPAEGSDLDAASDAFLDDTLLGALIASGLIFIALTQQAIWPYARYLTTAVIFGAILAARLVARVLEGERRRGVWMAVGGAGAVVVALFAGSVAVNLRRPLPPQYAAGLATFLEQHHLSVGLGDYWSSSITTVESGGAVKIRPVIAGVNGRLIPYVRNSRPTWFTGRYQFFVFEPPTPFGNANQTAAELTFGKPAQIYAIPGYIILVWSTPHALPAA